MKGKKHLTQVGLHRILAIKASLNLGLRRANLKSNFSSIIPVARPLVVNQQIKDPNWFAGFVKGEGCFFVDIYKETTRTGFSVKLVFKIGQHSRDQELMRNLISYLNCGKCNLRANQNRIEFAVRKFSNIPDKIIPFLLNTRYKE